MMFEQELCEPSRSGNRTCYIFAWVGQSFESCENCGKPYWEHLFDPTYGGEKGAYRIKVYLSYLDAWVWEKVNPITPERRAKTRAKWEGYYEWATKGRV
jgi:hypothetical protein